VTVKTVKYRAWHKAERVMGTVEVITIGLGAFVAGVKPRDLADSDSFEMAGHLVRTVPPSNGRFCPLDEIELLEFTGRHDMKGRDVYDGDVLYFPGNDHGYFIKWLSKEGAWGVMFSDKLQMGKLGMCQFMIVVGNVHSSPNLRGPA
jgi:hypothetical protein